MSASGCPAHLLLLDHALADDLVDSGLDEGTGDGLPTPIPLAVVGDPHRVGPKVTSELSSRLARLGLLGTDVHAIDVELEVSDRLLREEYVTVPQIPFQPLQLLRQTHGDVKSIEQMLGPGVAVPTATRAHRHQRRSATDSSHCD